MRTRTWIALSLASSLRVASAFVVPSPRVTLTKRDMCGLIAVLGDEPGNLPDITENTDRIRHRGPDGMQLLDSHDTFRMGHTRLAIVDPTHAGDQPFSLSFDVKGSKKKYHLVANGEIYNHEQVYAEIVKDGWKEERVSHSDCESIAHAFAARGVDCVSMLDGMFAFCVLEQDEETGAITSALAARDPVGIKPLYYGRNLDDSSYVFASELKALVGLVDPATVVAMPAGHYWTPETGLQCYYNPDWLRKVRIAQCWSFRLVVVNPYPCGSPSTLHGLTPTMFHRLTTSFALHSPRLSRSA